MRPPIILYAVQLTADIATEDGKIILRTSGSQLLFNGWLRAWEEPLAGATVSFPDGSGERAQGSAEEGAEDADDASEQHAQSAAGHQGRVLQVCLLGDGGAAHLHNSPQGS